LDRCVLNVVSRDRAERRRALYKTVLKDQVYSCGDTLGAESERCSLPARLFARTLALALAGDVQLETKEKRLVSF
jgi:hypothetical protein